MADVRHTSEYWKHRRAEQNAQKQDTEAFYAGFYDPGYGNREDEKLWNDDAIIDQDLLIWEMLRWIAKDAWPPSLQKSINKWKRKSEARGTDKRID